MKTLQKKTLRLSSAFAILSLVLAQASLACGDGPCEECDGKKAAQKTEQKAEQKTASGRKVKCSKCAEHGDAKSEAKGESKPGPASKT